MFRKFHERLKDHEEGFTLIELLVVILIIAILAAIAIPVFLNQRNKGYVAQAESALKNAATSMESFATSNNGTYPAAGDDTVLVSEGYRRVSGVTVAIASSSATGYCLTANHDKIDGAVDYVYSSSVGKPVKATAC